MSPPIATFSRLVTCRRNANVINRASGEFRLYSPANKLNQPLQRRGQMMQLALEMFLGSSAESLLSPLRVLGSQLAAFHNQVSKVNYGGS